MNAHALSAAIDAYILRAPDAPARRACRGCSELTHETLGTIPCCEDCGVSCHIAGDHELVCTCDDCQVYARVHSQPPPRGIGDVFNATAVAS